MTFAAHSSASMLGRRCADGPGGIKCRCCRQRPGRQRVRTRRRVKRAERQAWKSQYRD